MAIKLAQGMRIEWDSPILGTCQGEIETVQDGSDVVVVHSHSVTGKQAIVSLGWGVRIL